ncbi:hypothetical protein GGX14DRAFT_383885 [Mycena pura]|uniref:Uncharacterized protein n=1 Tax=Mycena pura TaxID=153505 RepID=A0AAD7E5F2_9AGAR|nr:hypothetical protein GGX14DRAFT_383885 [Mycena pura]
MSQTERASRKQMQGSEDRGWLHRARMSSRGAVGVPRSKRGDAGRLKPALSGWHGAWWPCGRRAQPHLGVDRSTDAPERKGRSEVQDDKTPRRSNDTDGPGRGVNDHQLKAKDQSIRLTAVEAEAAVADADLGVMMAPMFVAFALSPLALLGPVAYRATPYKSRVPLIETWIKLGNVHRVMLDDPLSILERLLWRLFFKLALKEITEVQVLQMFFEDVFVKSFLVPDPNKSNTISPGVGLAFASDTLDLAVETFVDEDLVFDVVDLPTVPAAAVPVPKKRKASAIDEGQEGPSAQEGMGAPNDEGREVPSAQEDAAANGDPIKTRLRVRTGKSDAPAALPAALPPPRKRVRHIVKPAASAGDEADDVESEDNDVESEDNDVESEDNREAEDAVNAEAAYARLRWLAVKDGWKPSLEHPPLTLRNVRLNPTRVLAPAVLHPLAAASYLVEIAYWKFDPAPDDPSETLRATRHIHLYLPFKATRSETKYFRKIVASQPSVYSAVYDAEVPLHVDPSAQRLHSSGDIVGGDGEPLVPDLKPDDRVSLVYVTHEDLWARLSAMQRQELLRHRAVLVIHRRRYEYDGWQFKFDEDSIERFTHLDRDAYIQVYRASSASDLGTRKDNKPPSLQVGRPRDLLVCRDMLEEHTASGSGSTGQSQRLNLLSNMMPSKTVQMPMGWTCNWVKGLADLPAFVFPWSEVNWAIFAIRDALTWIHVDVLFTVITLPTGKKLWFMGRRRGDLAKDDLRGYMRSRHAFRKFNGWTDMTDVWVFEQVHLSPYTTLFMPAMIPHCVISITHCIGAGRHGIPAANVSHCVFVSLHNAITAASTTNVDHEPARRFLVRMFIFMALAFTDLRNGADKDSKQTHRPTDSMRPHLPDLTTSSGIVDVLALRSFVILYLAFEGTRYAHAVGGGHSWALPVDTALAQELSFAWMLAHNLVDHITHTFAFATAAPPVNSTAQLPSSFSEAADIALVTMATSMHHYLKDDYPARKSDLPLGFTPNAFKQQLRRMLIMFELHAGLDQALRRAQFFANTSDGPDTSLRLAAAFDKDVAKASRTSLMLQPWNEDDLPFMLTAMTQ